MGGLAAARAARRAAQAELHAHDQACGECAATRRNQGQRCGKGEELAGALREAARAVAVALAEANAPAPGQGGLW
jgi:hypothetical protein